MGVFFSLITAFVLLDDVFRHDAPVNTKHVMTLAVLAGTIYFGHRLWPELRRIHLGTSLGCVLLFLAGTTTCVLMSAGRNAEVTTTKSVQANSVNTDRQRALRDRAEAKRVYEQAASGDDLSVREAKGSYDAAMLAAQTECQTGDGPACKAKRATTAERRKALEDAQANLRILAQLRKEDLDAAETRLAAQKPEQIANADIKAMAALIAQLPYVTARVEAIEASLQVAFPFLQSLFCEIAAIVGFSIGFGHRKSVVPEATVSASKLPPPLPETRPATKAQRVVPADPVIEALRQARRPLNNDELAAAMQVTKGESSKRVTELNGAVQRIRMGREVQISLPEWTRH